MALIPLSLPFEIIIPVFGLYFAEKGEFGRWIGICFWPLEIALLVLPLAFISDATGSPTLTTLAFPANILGIIVLIIFLIWIWSMVDLWYFRQGVRTAEDLTI